jgi:hypothetical protein
MSLEAAGCRRPEAYACFNSLQAANVDRVICTGLHCRECIHLEDQLQKLTEGSAADVRSIKDSFETEMAAVRMQHKQAVEQHQHDLATEAEELVSKHQQELEDALGRFRSEHEDIARLHKGSLAALEERCKADAFEQVRNVKSALNTERDAALADLKAKHNLAVAELVQEHEAALQDLQSNHADSEKPLADAIAKLEEDLQDAAREHASQLQVGLVCLCF